MTYLSKIDNIFQYFMICLSLMPPLRITTLEFLREFSTVLKK